MDSLEQYPDERGAAERMAARFAVLWDEQRRLAEQWADIKSSTAWALAQRLARWRRLLAPEGSRRQKILRFCLRSLRSWRREKAATPARSVSEGFRQPSLTLRAGVHAVPDRDEEKFRVAYVGSRCSIDAATMRYRAHNLIEALARAGLEGTFVPLEEIPAQLPTILSHDLVVVVRRIRNDATTAVIGAARQRGLPILFDADDYIFDPWILPYVEAFHTTMNQTKALRFMDDVGACLDLCDYFTGSTAYLAERAAALGKNSFVIRNGFNSAQLALSRLTVEQRTFRRGHETRIGYFSGTRSHQADFRVGYPALMRVLRGHPQVRLTIVGHLDMNAFPGLAPFLDQIELLPSRHWSELPATIAGVDINVIPLELTPFNEGKSNLKYYEAGLVQVPSIASPTRILHDSITHGHNGLLARTTEEWYDGLTELIARPDWRRQMGQNALEHVLQTYAPDVVGVEAIAAYRQILCLHRARHSGAEQTLRIVVLIADPQGGWEETLRKVNELAAAGHAVTVHVLPSETSASAVEKTIARQLLVPLFTVQRGGEFPCCDVLIAADSRTTDFAKSNQHRARLTIADEELLSTIRGVGRGLEPLLRDWLQNGPSINMSSHAA